MARGVRGRFYRLRNGGLSQKRREGMLQAERRGIGEQKSRRAERASLTPKRVSDKIGGAEHEEDCVGGGNGIVDEWSCGVWAGCRAGRAGGESGELDGKGADGALREEHGRRGGCHARGKIQLQADS